jgi:Tfp pilus assembly protein PilF
MNRAVRYFSVYLETDPGSFDAHYTMAGLHYNYFAYLQANRLYHRDLNMRALNNAEASLRKALESDPGNTDALEFLQTVQDLAGSQVSRK